MAPSGVHLRSVGTPKRVLVRVSFTVTVTVSYSFTARVKISGTHWKCIENFRAIYFTLFR